MIEKAEACPECGANGAYWYYDLQACGECGYSGLLPVTSARFDTNEVRDLLRQACRQAGSQRAWAAEHDCSATYVADVLSGRREPGEAILKPLGLRRVVSYERS